MEIFTYLLKRVSKEILAGNVINLFCFKKKRTKACVFKMVLCFYFLGFFWVRSDTVQADHKLPLWQRMTLNL